MARPLSRGLTLSDLAILVAGSAAAVAMWQFSAATLKLATGYDASIFAFTREYKIAIWPAPAMIALAFWVLLARSTRPRTHWRVFFRRPGNCAAVVFLAHLLIKVLAMSWREKLQPVLGGSPYHPNFNTYLYANITAGAWVAVCWATLAFSRSCRPESSWIDRAGRFLGAIAISQWIASMVIW